METKKNLSADPKRNSGLYFLIGLVSILFLSYVGIEMKTPDPIIPEEKLILADNNVDDDEDVIMTMPPEPKLPPPPPPAPEVIQIVKDEIKINEPKIQVTDPKQDEAIIIPKATDVGGKKGADDDFDFEGEVPFAVIEDIPLFPGCETVPKSKRQECFQEKMNAHIKKHFEYPRQAAEDEIQGRVMVIFIIDKEGNFTDLKTVGPKNGEDLEKEARRIFSKLPQITPGKQRNKPVKVKYAYPITFKLN